jgi:hypothetical protein
MASRLLVVQPAVSAQRNGTESELRRGVSPKGVRSREPLKETLRNNNSRHVPSTKRRALLT